MSYQAAEIARLIGGKISGDPGLVLNNVNSLELATSCELSFVSSPKHFKEGERSAAGCVIAPPGFAASNKTVIEADRPKASFVKVMWLFHPGHYAAVGIHPTAVVDPSASIGAEVSVGPLAVVGKHAKLGERVRIGPGTVVGDQVQIGDDALIYPHVTFYQGSVIGSRVVIHAGSVIGADGFGFVFEEGKHLKVPQLGNVVIEDDVEIGANCTIDRATFGSTFIKRGTKMDNLAHVAHNVIVGEHSILVAQVGIAGSSRIGHHVTLAGQVGIADNATLGDYVTVGGGSGVVTGQKIGSHETVWGTPARPIEEAKRQIASLTLLPEVRKKLRKLEERLDALEETLKQTKVEP